MRSHDLPFFAAFIASSLALASCSMGSPSRNDSPSGAQAGGCPAGSTSCNGVCSDLNSAANCGGCGHACSAGLVCSLGNCSDRCAGGLTACGSDCADLNTSAAHCGSCTVSCNGSCVAGHCQTSGGSSTGGSSGGGNSNNGNSSGNAGNSSNASGGANSSGNAGSASGSTGGAGGKGAAAGGSGPAGAFGGYITSGDWHGFAWTATSMNGGMVSPKDFGMAFDFPLCANGMVTAGDSNVAMVGWNLNQTTVDGDPAVMVSPKLKGINIGITNKGGSELRLQLQGPNGASDANDRWCAVIPGTGGFIPFDAFNTECWAGGMGKTYMGEPLVAAIVLVPGKMGTPVSFDFCVTKLAEANDANSTMSTGCSLSGSSGEGTGTLTGSDTRTVTRDGRQYVVQNNVWNGNSSNQSVTVSGVSFTVTAQSNSQATTGAPASFPSVFIGSNFGHSSSGSGLPKQVSALGSVQTGWKWTSASGTYNAAYDVWFSTNAGGDSGTPSGGYLMVWLHDPQSAQPLGSPSGTVSLGNKSWQVWTCSNCQNGVPVISYVPTGGDIGEWSFDLNDFIKNATTQFSVVKSNWYLTNIFAGFEIWSGGSGLKTDNFCAVVN